ncbi:hypothetical protein [Spirosoma sordidisoli]|nr:hypothetical protein [Spirosoma sordidisoli]
MNSRKMPLTYRLTLLTTLLLLSSLTYAQQRRRADDTSHYRTAPVPAHLMPIERAAGSSALGSVYFYGGKKLSSPYSLEIPFYELSDPTVTHHFQTFRTMTTLGRLVGLAPLVYVLLPKNRNNGTYWTIFGSSVVASLTFSIIGNSQVNKAVTRYNQMLLQPRVGLSVAPVPLTGQGAVGAGMAWSF